MEALGYIPKPHSWVVLEDYYEEVEAGSLGTVEVSAESESGQKLVLSIWHIRQVLMLL